MCYQTVLWKHSSKGKPYTKLKHHVLFFTLKQWCTSEKVDILHLHKKYRMFSAFEVHASFFFFWEPSGLG